MTATGSLFILAAVMSCGLGAVAVAIFVTTRTLANSARQIANVVGLALWPQVTALGARNERATLRALHRLCAGQRAARTVPLGDGAAARRVLDPVRQQVFQIQAQFAATGQQSGCEVD
jgi:hypothetical protein